MLLLSDPKVAAIPVVECGEVLVDLRENGGTLLVDTRKQDPAGSWARVRLGIRDRLLLAQSDLPDGVRLLVVEGHRPVELQRYYFDDHRADLEERHPEWTTDRVHAEASKHVSPPSVAPHPCGAAVDLTLWADGAELDLGTAINATPEESANACFTAADRISEQARHWRDVLATAMSVAGLVNYPPEWWHWSYGDRYWAATTRASAARYGPR